MAEPSKKADFAAGLTSSLKAGASKALPGAVGGAIPGGSGALTKSAGLPGAVGGGAQEAAKAAAAGAGKAAAGAGATAAAGGPSKAKAAFDTARKATTDPGRDQKSGSQKAGEAIGQIAAETATGAAQGAVAGGVGAVPGAIKGALVGAGKVTLKSKTGKIVIAAWIVASLLPIVVSVVLVNSMIMNVGKEIFASNGTAAQKVSADAVVGAGMDQATTDKIMSAVSPTGVPWQIVAAVYQAQRGPTDNPYKFTDAAGVTGASRTDLELASKQVASELVGQLKTQAAWRSGIDMANGASVSNAGVVTWTISDDSRMALRDAFVTALAALPLDGVTNNWAQQVYETALRWRLGLSSANGCPNTGAAPTTTTPASPSASASPTTDTSTGLIATSSTGEKVTVTKAMLNNVAVMVQVAQQAGLSNQAMLIASMTMAVESKWLNLASSAVPESLAFPNDGVVAGDHDSVNAFQQRAYSGAWGTPAQLMNQTYAASMFFGLSPPGAPANHARGLTQISGWETMDPGVAAQTVQVSAFPDRYSQWQQAASDMIGAAAGIQVPGNCAVIPGQTDATDTYGPYWASYGNPEGIDPWNFYWGECVSYAAYMVRTTTKYTDFTNNFRGQHFGNAYQWVAAARAAGLVVDTTPAVGSIAVRANINNGHVAYVTQVYPNGNIDVSEYNHAGKHIFGTRANFNPFTTASPNNQFQWFIHFELP